MYLRVPEKSAHLIASQGYRKKLTRLSQKKACTSD
jgi:hypothetical protein